jgi:uncharacterized protein
MGLLGEYRDARKEEESARLRRLLALRAMLATGMSQREVGEAVGISQSAVSQQLRHAPDLDSVGVQELLQLAAPVLKALAEDHGYRRLAVFGSVARGEAGPESDIDLLVDAPPDTSSFGFVKFQQLLERVLGREVDLVSYGGLKIELDQDIRRDAVLL